MPSILSIVISASLATQSGDASPGHWALEPIAAVRAPEVVDPEWSSSAIDRFVRARLDEEGIAPAPEADRRTLARRLAFDLTGLPPSPEEVAAFVADERPGAWARLVDRLLASPRYGERWGRHWLDVARFAESSGGGRSVIFDDAWRYRDWVIDSVNEDRPIDRWIVEQVAGDLLALDDPDERARALIATGFLAVGPKNLDHQDKEQLRMDVVDEQVDTIGRAFLGMTVGCARCHDHKFDPVSMEDYYALAGILRSTKTLTPGNVSGVVRRELPVSEELWVARRFWTLEERRLADDVKQATAALDGARQSVASLERDLPGVIVDDVDARLVGDWQESSHTAGFIGAGYLHDRAAKKGRLEARFEPDLPTAGVYEVRVSHTPGTNRSDAARVTVEYAPSPGARATASHRVDQRRPGAIHGRFTSLGLYRFDAGRGAAAVTVSNTGTRDHVIVDSVWLVPVAALESPSERDDERARELADLERREREAKDALAAHRARAPARPPSAICVEEEPEPADCRVTLRGDASALGDAVERGVLASVPPFRAAPIPAAGSGRMELARWIVSPENPLTARVFVNRVWLHLFGRGIVRTPDNFGMTGERPTHPELIDWLAGRFVESGWSLRGIVREVVLSRAYRSSSRPVDPSADPENRWLSHQVRRRLEAEAIRDAMLAVSGELDLRAGGATIRPGTGSEFGYRFETRGPGLRRSVYVPVFRNAMPDIYEVFDFANPNLVSGRRTTSTLPAQALYLMNSPFVLARAEATAARISRGEERGSGRALAGDDAPTGEMGTDDAGTHEARVVRLWERAVGRPPSQAELASCLRVLQRYDGAVEAWALVVQSVFASLDFRFVD